MTILDQPRWAFVALATPVTQQANGALAPDVARLAGLAKDVRAAGCNGVVPFGTTGEGPCFSVDQRRATIDGLIAAGIVPSQMVVGIGATAMADMVALAKHATALGCPVLAPPPFFMRIGDSAGIATSFSQLIAQVDDPALRVLIYNIPQVSGFPVSPDTMQTIARAHPGVVVGVKDSCPDWSPVEPVLKQRGDLKIAVGAEEFIPRAMALGGCGTICGLSNLAPAITAAAVDGDANAAAALTRLADAFDDRPFMATLKAAMAVLRDDDVWRMPMPPIDPLQADAVSDIVALVRSL